MKLLLLLLLAAPTYAVGEDTGFKIFSGEPRLIVVQGYSTSYHWPHLLKKKLDHHFGENHKIEIKSALRGGTPIAKWMNAFTGERLKPWIGRIQPTLESKGDRPAIVLAQQSLQWAFGERTQGIRTASDTARIRQGADVIATYIDHLVQDGADAVFMAMHIYKHPMEPEIGHERLALAAFLERGHPNVLPGPDVWKPTKEHYPKAFDTDGLHPGSIGIEIMAQLWFETLLKHDDLAVPEWSRQQMTDANTGQPNSLLVLRHLGILPEGDLKDGPRWKRVLEDWDGDEDGELNTEEEMRWVEAERERILAHPRSQR